MRIFIDVLKSFFLFSLLIWTCGAIVWIGVNEAAGDVSAAAENSFDTTIYQCEWLAIADQVILDDFHWMAFHSSNSYVQRQLAYYCQYLAFEQCDADEEECIGFDEDGLFLDCDGVGNCEGDD